MPLEINQKECIACGSCIGNCPNRAIVRRGEQVCITDMCNDCGECVRYCPINAIGKGTVAAVLNVETLARDLKTKLSLSKQIAAMKFVNTLPDDIPLEKGPHFWCGMCGDIFDGEDNTLVFTAEASTCGGCANIGLGARKVDRDDFITACKTSTVGPGKLYATKAAMTANRRCFPPFDRVAKGVIIGPLSRVQRPDIVIFPLTGRQMCMVATAFGYETGEVMQGFAGKSTCLMTVSTPLETNRPVFTAGDHGGRMFMRLADDEILVSFPFSLIPGLVKCLDKTVFAQEE